uniref:Cyclopropane-fatty-acyl-phospholipid synthase n=1 Tax=Aquifex aeolicus (strain VF5) TaxID=224324 RepID=UPI001EAE837E|nr:Chain A, Cyclopropane-fatty-acyl-phospholipid synthase [Aquifex aeolicus VF5]7QOS_B Chain B, Cyclopropane-fatty-acyl-phospholipid synthase [Aquifex aeolicus VF5]
MIKEAIVERIVNKLNENQKEKIGVELPSGKRIPEFPVSHLIRFKTWKSLDYVLKDPEMGFGEGYMNGDIEVEGDLEEVIKRGMTLFKDTRKFEKLFGILRHVPLFRTIRDERNVKHHYDLGNDFYRLWLDKSMTYSCAFFEDPSMSIDEAQSLKRRMIYEKLQLKEGDTLLDIGCGWGSIILESAELYNVKSVGITLSDNQYEYVKEEIKKRGLQDKVEVYKLHYVDLPKLGRKFNKVVSVGMFEHVGKENYETFFNTVYRVMEEGGLFLLHTIGKLHPDTQSRWIRKYIFPGGYLPSISEIVESFRDMDFTLIDFDNWRMHYYWTLKKWKERFYENLDKIRNMFDDRFIRMWELYLTASAVSFLIGSNYVFQTLLSKGVKDDYPVIKREFSGVLFKEGT